MTSTTEGDYTRSIKVARLLEKYDLEGLGDELVQLWTTETDDRRSLRDLSHLFNKRLFEAALANAGVSMLADEIDSRYRILTGGTADTAERTRVRRQLEREGLNVDEVVNDFVSYQAIRTYLKEYRDVEYTKPDTNRVSNALGSIQRLRSRTVTVTESRLDQLRNVDEIALGEYRTIIDLNVICEDCGTQYDVSELLERKGCGCHRNDMT